MATKTTKKLNATNDKKKENLNEDAIFSIEKTLKQVYFATTTASKLLSVLSKRTDDKTRPRVPNKLAIILEYFLFDWREYLLWLSEILENTLEMLRKQDLGSSQLQMVINLTKNIQYLLRNGEHTLIFAIIQLITSYASGKTKNSFRVSNLLWIAISSFFNSQLDTILPGLQSASKSLSDLFNDNLEIVNNSIQSYWENRMSQLKETNPERYKAIKRVYRKIEMAKLIPVLFESKGTEYYTAAKEKYEQYQPVVKYLAEVYYKKAFKKFNQTFGQVSNLSVSTVMNNSNFTKKYSGNIGKAILAGALLDGDTSKL